MSKPLSQLLNYLTKYEGMKYTKYDFSHLIMTENEPFWVSNTPVPDYLYVYYKGSTCVGLINILRRYNNLQIPGIIDGKEKHALPGGTGSWFEYLDSESRLVDINLNEVYPPGTLLLQDFNLKDQGHVAVLLESNDKLINSKIIHNINGTWDNKQYDSTVIEKLNEFPNYSRFTHVCLPSMKNRVAHWY